MTSGSVDVKAAVVSSALRCTVQYYLPRRHENPDFPPHVPLMRRPRSPESLRVIMATTKSSTCCYGTSSYIYVASPPTGDRCTLKVSSPNQVLPCLVSTSRIMSSSRFYTSLSLSPVLLMLCDLSLEVPRNHEGHGQRKKLLTIGYRI